MLRNGGKWTQSRFNSFIKSGLRAMSRRWGPKFECLADACVGTKTNKATGRMAKHYECAECHNQFPAKEVAVDHIKSVIGPEGFVSWDEVIDRMFVEKEGLQVLCKSCHSKEKTAIERAERASYKKMREDFPKEFSSWYAMNRRCSDPKFAAYKWYGGKGICVCDRWKRDDGIAGFVNFLQDMGRRPDGCTIDRVDYAGDYEPGNCRWADELQQKRNTSRTVWAEVKGELLCLSELSEKYGVGAATIGKRLRWGWTPEQAVGIEERVSKSEIISQLTQEDLEWFTELLSDKGRSMREVSTIVEIPYDKFKYIVKKFKLK